VQKVRIPGGYQRKNTCENQEVQVLRLFHHGFYDIPVKNRLSHCKMCTQIDLSFQSADLQIRICRVIAEGHTNRKIGPLFH